MIVGGTLVVERAFRRCWRKKQSSEQRRSKLPWTPVVGSIDPYVVCIADVKRRKIRIHRIRNDLLQCIVVFDLNDTDATDRGSQLRRHHK